MKKFISILGILGFIACNNATESTEQVQDTSASSSADSIMKAVEKMKADSAAMQRDSTGRKRDTLKK